MRKSFRVVGFVLIGLVLGVAGALVGLTRTRAGQALVMAEVLKRIEAGLQGQISIGDVRSPRGLHRQALLVDVEVRAADDTRVFTADSLDLSYSVRELIRGEVLLRDVKLFRPRVWVTRAAADRPFSVQAVITAPDSLAPPEDPWLKSLILEDLTVSDGEVTYRDPLPEGADPGGIRTERVLGQDGLFRAVDVEGLSGVFPRIGVIDPDEPGVEIGVANVAGIADWTSTPVEVRRYAGRVSLDDGILTVAIDDLRLPLGTVLQGSVRVDLEREQPDHVRLASAEFDTGDLDWLLPDLPRARGATSLEVDRDSGSMRVELIGARFDFDDGVVSGGSVMTWTTGSTQPFISQTDLTLQGLGAGTAEAFLGIEIPFGGRFDGQLSVVGPLDLPTLRGRLTHRRSGFASTTVDVEGAVVTGEDPGARTLDLTFPALSLGLVDAYSGTGFDPMRTVSGRVALDGRLRGGLNVDMEASYVDRQGEPSRVMLNGSIARPLDELEFDLEGAAERLYFPGLVEEGSRLAALGVAEGSVAVRGSVSELEVSAGLVTAQGDLSVLARFDGRDPFAGYTVTAVADRYEANALVPTLPENTLFGGSVTFVGSGRDLDTAVLDASVDLRDARIARLPVDSLNASGRLAGGMIQVDDLVGTVGGTLLTGAGTLGTTRERPGRLELQASTDDLEGIRPYFLGDNVIAGDTLSVLEREILAFEGIDPDTLPDLADVRMTGSLVAAVVVTGAIDSMAVDADIELDEATYGPSYIEHARIDFLAEGLPSVEPHIDALVETGPARILERSFDSTSVRLDYTEPRGRTDIFLVRSEQEDYRAHVAFDWSDSVRILNLDEMTLRFPDERWNLGGPATIAWDPDGLTFANMRLIRPGQDGLRVSAQGRYPFRGEADLELAIEELDLERVRQLLQLEERVEGVIDLSLSVTGTAEDPRLEGRVDADSFRFREYVMDRLAVGFSYAERRLSGQSELWTGGQQALVLSGGIPAVFELGRLGVTFPDEAVDLELRTDSLPVSLLMAPFEGYENVQGTLSGEVSILGTLDRLAPTGELRMTGGSAFLEGIGVQQQDVEATFRLQPDGIVEVVGGASARGRATLSGTVDLNPVRDPTLDLRIELDNFQMMQRRDVEARLSGGFDIDGTYRRPVISGDLAVQEGVLYLDEFVRTASVLDLGRFGDGGSLLDEELLAIRPLLSGQNPFLRNVRMEGLRLAFNSNAWVRSGRMDVELGGQLDVLYDRAVQEVTLVGTLNALRGQYRQFNRAFNVQQGTLRFLGTPGINPDLDIQATSRVRTVDGEALAVTANVTGTLVTPLVTLSSDQAGYTQEDLIAYMIFGRPTYGLTSSQSQALNVGSLFLGGAATVGLNSLLNIAATDFGWVDYLTFTQQDAGELGGRNNLLSSLTLETGSYVGDDLFLTLLIRPGATGETGGRFAGLQLEYAAGDAFTIEAAIEERFFRGRVVTFGNLAGQNELGLGLFFFKEWGY